MNKTQIVLDYLKKGNYITDAKAVELCNSYRLSSIIYTLRHNYGILVQDRWRETKEGTRYKEYYLKEEDRNV